MMKNAIYSDKKAMNKNVKKKFMQLNNLVWSSKLSIPSTLHFP